MADTKRRVRSGQVNFTLDPHWYLVLRLAAEADDTSVPDLIRPVIMRYLRGRMRDGDLREAVERLEQHRLSRRSVPDNITAIPTAGSRAMNAASSKRRSKKLPPTSPAVLSTSPVEDSLLPQFSRDNRL